VRDGKFKSGGRRFTAHCSAVYGLTEREGQSPPIEASRKWRKTLGEFLSAISLLVLPQGQPRVSLWGHKVVILWSWGHKKAENGA
jgi:hypothetical protein